MKWINKLNNKDLEEIYSLFIGENSKIIDLEIFRKGNSIDFYGTIRILCEDEEYYEVQDDYTITDYRAVVYDHSGSVVLDYRKYMYKKFGEEYARDFLLGNYTIDCDNDFETKEIFEV